ncbi:MAG: DUF2271 domain-containing protein [Clostridiales bacterium]|jgi:hypothetical protein|nr:DUF2271 domain-containing protein [Clostridiales bacterium]
MRKKLILVTLTAIIAFAANMYNHVANPFNFNIYPLAKSRQAQSGKTLEITFSYEKQLLAASSQYAFWIEDTDGNYVDTLYVTRYTGLEGHRRRPQSLPKWVSKANPNDMKPFETDAVTGATPRSGGYAVYWDFTDRNGKPVKETEYRYFIEATLYMGDNALYSGTIAMGAEPWQEYPEPEYSKPDSRYKNMISNVRVLYYP